jgi:hypothetical protein
VITIDTANYPNCEIVDVQLAFSAVAGDGATPGDLVDLGGGWVLRFDHPGAGPLGFDLIQLQGKPLAGPALGSGACAIQFADGADLFPSTAPPYDGVFEPLGPGGTLGQPGFGDYRGKLLGGEYGLYPAFLAPGSEMTITCYEVVFVVQDAG